MSVLQPKVALQNVINSAHKYKTEGQASHKVYVANSNDPPVDLSKASAIIIGSGVGGLAMAYELENNRKTKMTNVTVLEARDRIGGRCLTLHDKDEISESKDASYDDHEPSVTQTVNFPHGHGEREGLPKVYLNAGPGRIPSSHALVHHYLKKFNVPVEVYVMQSSSNLVAGNKDKGVPSIPYRQLQHNIRGNVAKYIANHTGEVAEYFKFEGTPDELAQKKEQLQEMMQSFGGLVKLEDEHGKVYYDYKVATSEPGRDDTHCDRAGYIQTPEDGPGIPVETMELAQTLDWGFWNLFYQQMDYLWQPTLVQPVGGMDQVPKSFEKNLKSTKVLRNSPVQHITYLKKEGKFQVTYTCQRKGEVVLKADYLFCNLSMVFLDKLLDPSLKGLLDKPFLQGLQAIWDLDKCPESPRFLSYTTKVGWQAKRDLWQYEIDKDSEDFEGIRQIPMYGGISWSNQEITQIWYPSMDFYDEYGVLTGCYNFREDAERMGNRSVKDRLQEAKRNAIDLDKTFGEGLDLECGVSVAWHKVPYIKGGWAQWDALSDHHSVSHFNNIRQGSAIDSKQGPRFFIIGDQVSCLPGWQEGAIASSLCALRRLHGNPIPTVSQIPSSLALVEGIAATDGALAASVICPDKVRV